MGLLDVLQDVVLDRVKSYTLTSSSLMREEFCFQLLLVAVIQISSSLRVVVPSLTSVPSGSVLTSSSFAVIWDSHVVVSWLLGPFSLLTLTFG